MKRRLPTRDARVAWSLFCDSVRASALDAPAREAVLALGRAALEGLDPALDGRARKRVKDARRALAGAPPEGHGYEYRRIASVLDRSVRALPAAHALVSQRMLGEGEDAEVVDAAAPILAWRLVMRLLWASLVVIDERLVLRTSVFEEAPCARIFRRLADGAVVIDGAIADLLLDTGALDTRRDPHKIRSVERTALQQAIRARLRAPRKR